MNQCQRLFLIHYDISEGLLSKDVTSMIDKLAGIKDDALSRLTGVKKNLKSFRKQFISFIKDRTPFKSFGAALTAFVPEFKANA